MLGLDTNVLERLLIRDDAAQLKRAEELVRGKCTSSDPGWVSVIVLCKVVWVLETAYGYKRPSIQSVIEHLLKTPISRVENEVIVSKAVKAWSNCNCDLADMLIAERNLYEGCKTTYTFDRKAAKQSGFTAVP
jgi:predicted nucleic-acid-binding protein